jgi:M6 family metalloprotease-like protein
MSRSKLIMGFLFCLILVLVIPAAAYALQPPTAQQIEQYKKDGSFSQRAARAEMIGNHKTGKFLARRAQRKTEKMVLKARGLSDEEINAQMAVSAPPPAWTGLQTSGTQKVLVLLVDFPEYPHQDETQSVNDFNGKFTGSGDPALYPYESLGNYYQRSSYNKLKITTGVVDNSSTSSALGWYRAQNPRSYYEKLGDGAGQDALIKEAINYYDAQGQDFAQYDNNSDGAIDAVYLKWTGPNNGWANFWWAYQWVFHDATYTVDGKSLSKYVWSWYGADTYTSTYWQGEYEPRVDIHETGHLLGLPDYYDYKSGIGPEGGVGGLDMMDNNWGDHNCFSKFLLDWISPEFIPAGSSTKTFEPSGVSQDAALIMPGATNNIFSQYFMVQYRKRDTGNDPSSYPTDGMLIWHVDATLNSSGTDFVYDNSYTTHKLLALEQADGLGEIEADGWADAGDYYINSKSFDPNSIPNSNNYANKVTNVYVDNFTAPNITMEARLSIQSKDLTVVSVDAPSSAMPNKSISVITQIKNQGNIAADSFKIKIYLSKDTVITTKDTYLGQVTVSSLAGGATQTFTANVTLPKTLRMGTKYYVGAMADATNVIAESNESNNTGYDSGILTISNK